MPKISFAICEKSYLIRKGLASVIEKIPDTKLTHEIDNEEEIISFVKKCEVDFLIINKNLLHNPLIIKALKLMPSNTNLIILNSNLEKEISGIKPSGYIHIDDSQSILIEKIKEISRIKSGNKKAVIPDEISKREADILRNIALGFSNKEIADKLFISTHTVVTHRKNITRKLGIKTAPGLTIYAIINKLIDINEAQ